MTSSQPSDPAPAPTSSATARTPGPAPVAPPGPPPGPRVVERTAVRVLLFDDDGRVLLLRGRDPVLGGPHYWFTVGGGLEPHESPEQAASREAREETGAVLRPEAVVPLGLVRLNEFPLEHLVVRQDEHFVAAQVPAFDAAPTALEAPEVRQGIVPAWWRPEHLAAQLAGRPHPGPGHPADDVYPPDLLELLERARAALTAHTALTAHEARPARHGAPGSCPDPHV